RYVYALRSGTRPRQPARPAARSRRLPDGTGRTDPARTAKQSASGSSRTRARRRTAAAAEPSSRWIGRRTRPHGRPRFAQSGDVLWTAIRRLMTTILFRYRRRIAVGAHDAPARERSGAVGPRERPSQGPGQSPVRARPVI